MQSKALLRLLVASFVLTAVISACVEPYDLDYTQNKRILTIDGLLSDNPASKQQISIRESIPTGSSNFYQPISEVVVEVVVNNSERFRFLEIEKGIYEKPTEMLIEGGKKYRLDLKFPDGRTYVSDDESFTATPPIDRVYTELEPEGIPKNIGYSPAHFIYLDTKDEPGRGDNFVWSWKLYEKQNICESCANGRYFIDRRTGVGACRDESTPFQEETFYNDYQCDGGCWQVFYNTEINAMSDTYVDGNPIIGRLVAKIPVYQTLGALVEIKQQSLTPSAFRYLKLLTEQSQNNGGLADTPPAALVGNVRNVNEPNETVGGYFMVSSERVALVWLDRRDVAEQRLAAQGLLGRQVSLEVSQDPSRPPLAPCVNSRSRTPFQPEGWVN